MEGSGDLVSEVISGVIIGVTPFRVLVTLLITCLLSPLPLQVDLHPPCIRPEISPRRAGPSPNLKPLNCPQP